MLDYFMDLLNKLSSENSTIEIIRSDIVACKMENTFDHFKFGITDQVKYLYDNYKRFLLSWEEKSQKIYGYVDFVPYNEIEKEHESLCDLAEDMEKDLIEDQDIVINDLSNWYPVFRFSNGDAFCYDKRNGRIVFFEHEVFDTGVNLHGLVIAETVDSLLKNWSKVLFVDIYDWYDGVSEQGIDLHKPVFEKLIEINGSLQQVNQGYISI